MILLGLRCSSSWFDQEVLNVFVQLSNLCVCMILKTIKEYATKETKHSTNIISLKTKVSTYGIH